MTDNKPFNAQDALRSQLQEIREKDKKLYDIRFKIARHITCLQLICITDNGEVLYQNIRKVIEELKKDYETLK
jgi:hypothetical protein